MLRPSASIRVAVAVAAVLIASACTPAEVRTWYQLHGLPVSDADVVQVADIIDAPAGWIDLGHGIYGPAILADIRWCESRGQYDAANRHSSARGAYQFLSGSWRWYGHADRYGSATADQALPWQQDEAAVFTWLRDGTRPWNASRPCWANRP